MNVAPHYRRIVLPGFTLASAGQGLPGTGQDLPIWQGTRTRYTNPLQWLQVSMIVRVCTDPIGTPTLGTQRIAFGQDSAYLESCMQVSCRRVGMHLSGQAQLAQAGDGPGMARCVRGNI